MDGKNIPLVDFDAGDSWAGLLPISSHPNETRQVCVHIFRIQNECSNPPSFSFGITLRVRMVAKTISYSGNPPPITTRVGAKRTADHTLYQDKRRSGLLSSRGFLARERGMQSSCALSRISVLKHAHTAYQLAVGSGKANPEPLQLDESGTYALGRTTRWDRVFSGCTEHPSSQQSSF